MRKKVAIIGAGIGGLAAAIRLAVKGYHVSVFEKNDQPGGKISQIEQNGFRFDTGPSVFTLPELVDELFYLAGKKPENYISYSKLQESCKYFYEDGTEITAHAQKDLFISELAEKTGEDPTNLDRFLARSKTIYDITSDVFVFQSIHDRNTIFRASSLKALLNFHKIDAFRTMHEANSKQFTSEKVIQFFNRYATYNGSNPYQVPATLNIIPHLENNLGAFFPENGMYSIIEGLFTLAKDIGVTFNMNTTVLEIEPQDSDFVIKTSQEEHRVKSVVNDTDITYFYQHILKDKKKLNQVLKHEKSSSALIFYWGVNKECPQLNLHNILFSDDYEKEFDWLFNKKQITDDPTVYIFISSKNNGKDAPNGKENWYVMINAPENTGQDWSKLKQAARKNIIRKINRMLNTDIENFIETEISKDPVLIEAETASYHGSLYGNSSNSKFAAFNRHPNFSRKYKGLYFVGGSVHPGGGIPLCLSSAKIVANKLNSIL